MVSALWGSKRWNRGVVPTHCLKDMWSGQTLKWHAEIISFSHISDGRQWPRHGGGDDTTMFVCHRIKRTRLYWKNKVAMVDVAIDSNMFVF